MVMGVPFRIELTDTGEENVGETLGLHRKIAISQALDTKRIWSVLVHEWAHAVLYANGVANILGDSVEEVIAQSLEHAVEELLKQVGPELVHVFNSEERD